MSTQEQADIRDNVPRVVHLGYFDAVLDGVRAGLNFDELRLRLLTVSNDLARFSGRRLPVYRTDPSVLWATTRDALEGLMGCELIDLQPLPSRKEALPQHADKKYRLTGKGRELLAKPSVGAQRDTLGAELYRAHEYFRRYLERLEAGALFYPEFGETDLERFHAGQEWKPLASEVSDRLLSSPASQSYDPDELADELKDFVHRRFPSARPWSKRKELLDAVLDGIVAIVSKREGLLADPTTLGTLHEWGRQLFLTGSSRYVADVPGGLLHWSASSVEPGSSGVIFHRQALPESAPAVVQSVARAYKRLLRSGTRLVDFYRLRGTAAFDAGVSNDLVDRVVAAMISGQLPNPYLLQPASGAQWRQPPSEPRGLRIGDRRYTVVTFMREPKEDEEDV